MTKVFRLKLYVWVVAAGIFLTRWQNVLAAALQISELQFQAPQVQIFELPSSVPECPGPIYVQLNGFTGSLDETVVPIEVTSLESKRYKGVLVFECLESATARLSGTTADGWAKAWMMISSGENKGAALLGTPLNSRPGIMQLSNGWNALEFELYMPKGIPLTLNALESAVPIHGTWSEDRLASLGLGWTNEDAGGVLAWTTVSGTPLLTQLKSLRSCVQFSDLLFPVQTKEDCVLFQPEVFYDDPMGTRWVLRDGVPMKVIEATLAKPMYPGEVIITEVMWGSSFDGQTYRYQDFWFELFNPTSKTWNLSGMKLAGASTATVDLSISAKMVLPPGGYLVIGAKRGVNTSLSKDPDYVISGIRFWSHTNGFRLKSHLGGVLDAMPAGEWQAGYVDLEGKVSASAQRKRTDLPGDQWTSWASCEDIPEGKCTQLWPDIWKKPGQNMATPWHHTVL